MSQAVVHRRRSSNMLETLEKRQLLSLVIDTRLVGGGSSATITGTGQVINMEVWATVTGKNSQATDEGLQDVYGAFLSSNTSGGAALGALSSTLVAPFNGAHSSPGKQQDLDGDSDLDQGTLTNSGTDVFLSRSDTMTTAGGTISGKSQSWKIATLKFTVSKLLLGSGAFTEIKFVPRIGPGTPLAQAPGGVWQEDGVRLSTGVVGSKGTETTGTVVTLRRNIGTIAGKVFNDKNSNGVRDANEGGIGNWTLYIDSNKNRKFDPGEITTVASGGGNYAFTDLKAGNYRIRIAQQSGWRKTHPLGSFYDVALGVGELAAGKNWAETTNVIITGSVFNDANGNAVKDGGEGVWGGWRVFADLNSNGVYDSKADLGVLTDASGNFTISTLPPGAYKIVASTATGYSRTIPTSGTYSLTLSAAHNSNALVFGVRKIS